MPEKANEVSLAEAAAIIGVSKRRVQAIISDGSGRLKVSSTVRIGGLVAHMLLRSDVEKFAKLERPRGRQPAAKPAKRKGKK